MKILNTFSRCPAVAERGDVGVRAVADGRGGGGRHGARPRHLPRPRRPGRHPTARLADRRRRHPGNHAFVVRNHEVEATRYIICKALKNSFRIVHCLLRQTFFTGFTVGVFLQRNVSRKGNVNPCSENTRFEEKYGYKYTPHVSTFTGSPRILTFG